VWKQSLLLSGLECVVELMQYAKEYSMDPAVLTEFVLSKFYGQATKGTWWMPWRVKAMKDVASCDKLGRGANNP
jgi:hypothetical protein